jgi:hypothetical protein
MMLNRTNELSSFRNFIAEFSREFLICFSVRITGSILREYQNRPNHHFRETELTAFSFDEFSLS